MQAYVSVVGEETDEVEDDRKSPNKAWYHDVCRDYLTEPYLEEYTI